MLVSVGLVALVELLVWQRRVLPGECSEELGGQRVACCGGKF